MTFCNTTDFPIHNSTVGSIGDLSTTLFTQSAAITSVVLMSVGGLLSGVLQRTVVSVFAYVSSFFWSSLYVQNATEETLADQLEKYLREYVLPSVKPTTQRLTMRNNSVQCSVSRQLQTFRFYPDIDGAPHIVWVTVSNNGQSGSFALQGQKERFTITLSSFGWWSMPSLKLFVREAHKVIVEMEKNNVVLYTPSNYGRAPHWEFLSSRSKREPPSVVITPGAMTRLIDDIQSFLAQKSWYEDRGLNYRRGYLLHGVPGAGKTSTVVAIASSLGLGICIANMSDMSDKKFQQIMSGVQKNTIVLIEDVDVAFVSRDTNKTTSIDSSSNKDNKIATLTMSGFLNAIDGVAASEGRILIMTTNYLERLDAAMIRAGRVDMKIAFDTPTRAQIVRYFARFYRTSATLCQEKTINLAVDSFFNTKYEDWMCTDDEVAMGNEFYDAFVASAGTLSMAALQSYLSQHPHNARAAIENVAHGL